MPTLGWLQIFRLGLVQTALGAIVVLCTSTMNRVMVVELALPATLPGLLVGAHYAVQLARPKFGYDSDVGGRRTPWIVGGIATLAGLTNARDRVMEEISIDVKAQLAALFRARRAVRNG